MTRAIATKAQLDITADASAPVERKALAVDGSCAVYLQLIIFSVCGARREISGALTDEVAPLISVLL